jgi:hypothetical protein
VSECDREASIIWRPWPTGACCAILKKKKYFVQSAYHEGLQCALYVAWQSVGKGINFPEVKAAGN